MTYTSFDIQTAANLGMLIVISTAATFSPVDMIHGQFIYTTKCHMQVAMT